MRCDLHVHSWHSGPAELPVLEHLGRECYSEPLAVYERARRRGMDLVTLTDHDSIDGALALAHLPDTFVSEEVTVGLEAGRKLHLGVFDIDADQHEHVQRLRFDAEALFAYLAEQRIPACVNHLFSVLTGRREPRDLTLPLGRLRLIEALNGAMPRSHNEWAARVGRLAGMAPVGGSDSHTLAGVARAFTTVPGARNKQEFLAGLRRGCTLASGRSGSYARLTAEVTRIFAAGYRDAVAAALAEQRVALRPLAALLLAPLVPLLPLFTAGVHLHERRFGARQFAALGRAWRPRLASPLSHPPLPALRAAG
jgi:predicted metal-dependent phosphoesterase TrpH